MEFKNAKAGENVYCLLNGHGTILFVNEKYEYITIEFVSFKSSYNFKGCLDISKNRTLYYSKPEIIEPKRQVEKAFDVWVNYYADSVFNIHQHENEAREESFSSNLTTYPAKLTFTITE